MQATSFEMKPVFALVGRPNVGKSTLFNQLTKTRDALVADFSGLTRDRQYGQGRLGDWPFQVVDTGGLAFGEKLPSPGVRTKTDQEKFDQLQLEVEQQVTQAIGESQVVLMVMDARAGITPMDQTLLQLVRRADKPFMLVVNKVDGLTESVVTADFSELGIADLSMVTASHGRGLLNMLEKAHQLVPQAFLEEARATAKQSEDFFAQQAPKQTPISFAVVGRPNVGKSTLCNRLLGEQRVVVCDLPGTTRDSVFIPFTAMNKPYVLIDTAGVRRRGKVSQTVEKFSVLKAFKAVEAADVILSVIDANEPFVDQDLHILSFALEANKPVILVVNKWDGVKADIKQQIRSIISRRLHFLKDIPIQFTSALHGTGVGHLYEKIHAGFQAYTLQPSTTHLNKILKRVVEANPPPMAAGRPIKLRFVGAAGTRPPRLIFHGTQTKRLPEAYKKFLLNSFRAALQIPAMPLQLEFRDSVNPFKDRKNALSERQLKKRKRLVKHIRRTAKKR